MKRNRKILLAILGVIVGLFSFYYFSVSIEDRSHKEDYLTKKRMETIKSSLNEFYAKCSRFPTSEEGIGLLQINSDKCGYLASDNIKILNLVDAKGNAFIYTAKESSYELRSTMRDGLSIKERK